MEFDKEQAGKMISLLEEIRDNQKQQLAQQTESLEMQKEQFGMVKAQYERASGLQARAERLQEKGSALVEKSRKIFVVIVPLLLVLLGYLTWLMIR